MFVKDCKILYVMKNDFWKLWFVMNHNTKAESYTTKLRSSIFKIKYEKKKC